MWKKLSMFRGKKPYILSLHKPLICMMKLFSVNLVKFYDQIPEKHHL